MNRLSTFDLVLDIINKYDPEVRTRKVSNADALREIEKVLRSGVSWRHLLPRIGTFSCIYKRFTKWSRLGLFENVWKELLKLYSNKRLEDNPRWFKDIYIDSTLVKNIAGVDCVGKNPTDRGRLGTKTSVICDDNLVPISCTHYAANIADVKTMLTSFDAINCNLKVDNRYTVNLIGDKGYIAEAEKEILYSIGVNLITPFRKNAMGHCHVNKVMKQRLKKRRKIENVFCRMDKLKKIQLRSDRFISQFESWNFLAMALMTMEGINRLNVDVNIKKTCLKS
jgi:putative transposase